MRAIARSLGRSVSTISDEIRHNSVRGRYDPKKAAHKAYVRRKYAKYQGMKIVGDPGLFGRVEELLREGRSPESIAGRITKHERHLPSISADSIERFLQSVYGRRIEAARERLTGGRKRHRRRKQSERLHDRRFIDRRPPIIERRGRVGDVEADFIVSGKAGRGVLLTVVDRKLRVSFLALMLVVTIENVHRAFLTIQRRFPELRSISTDNDILFVRHQELAILLGVPLYFCHPYHSWEKGSIENVNGEIRKVIPRGSDLSSYNRRTIQKIEATLNDRYMKCLSFLMPSEALAHYRTRKKSPQTKKPPRRGCSD